ncbi:hypothetical protein [Ideonella paludis]|uniref:Uncharacterized protein n=1 Tax=Ideonella paludis TaxID=1233411 RepID=A0ABS5DX41_9BURK|nr:hypothetical protein [Ideonella paludis]MBQ0935705.1 hypothetical protein [Ideonella paludis]
MKPYAFCAPLAHVLSKPSLMRQAQLTLDPLSLGPLLQALMHSDTLSVCGSTSGRCGDRVTVLVNNLPVRGSVDERGRFAVAVPVAQLMAKRTPTLSAVVIATDDQGTPAVASGSLTLPAAEMRRAWAHRSRAGLHLAATACLAGVSHA